MKNHDAAYVSALEEQINALRNQHNQLRRRTRATCIAFAVCAVVCTTLTGATLQQIGRFQQSVQVDDANSRLRAVLYADNSRNRSGLEIRDPNGRKRCAIETNQNHDPYIQFFDINGRKRIEMGIDPQGEAYLGMADRQGNLRHELRAR